jgi:transcriptional regulator with XRE-family HTH domain
MQKRWIVTEKPLALGKAMKKAASETFMAQVGRRLAAARSAAGFNQAQFAKRLKLPSAANLSNWENGWAMVPPEYAAKIFLLTKVDANYLYLGDPSQLPHSIYERLFTATQRDNKPRP